MTLRKGQNLINEVTLRLQRSGDLDPNERDVDLIRNLIEGYIWNMSDSEFDEIMMMNNIKKNEKKEEYLGDDSGDIRSGFGFD